MDHSWGTTVGSEGQFNKLKKSVREETDERTVARGWSKYPKSKTVGAYIAAAPKNVQPKLREVRSAIRAVAPKASESISYRLPYYSYKGQLAWFGFHSSHIGLYLRPPVIEEHKSDLKGYETTKSAVHLPLDRKVPVQLVKNLVRAAMKKNESR